MHSVETTGRGKPDKDAIIKQLFDLGKDPYEIVHGFSEDGEPLWRVVIRYGLLKNARGSQQT